MSGSYYIEYPIGYRCNLKCGYCFHSEQHIAGVYEEDRFTVADYIRWRDKNIMPAPIVVHPSCGEPFFEGNLAKTQELFDGTDVERFDVLTNGVCDQKNYAVVEKHRMRINRIGMTYHRSIIGGNAELRNTFNENLDMLVDLDIPVYVKELLIPELYDEIAEDVQSWRMLGASVKVQDFKGWNKGISKHEGLAYSRKHIDMISPEYLHFGPTCQCGAEGSTNILIRGGWRSGDVVACWEDPTIVGNIQDGWYNSGYRTARDVTGVPHVEGVEHKYGGTRDRDLPVESVGIAPDSYLSRMRCQA